MTDDHALDSIHALATFYGMYPDGQWSSIGERLHAQVGGKGVRIVLHPAGAIPFYSDLDTIDMLGLNDSEIPGHFTAAPAVFQRPGHQWWVTLRYLEDKQVTLVIGDPTMVPPGLISSQQGVKFLRRWMRVALPLSAAHVPQAVFVALPIDDRRSLVAWYLIPSPAFDGAARQPHWEFAEVDFDHGTLRGGRAH